MCRKNWQQQKYRSKLPTSCLTQEWSVGKSKSVGFFLQKILALLLEHIQQRSFWHTKSILQVWAFVWACWAEGTGILCEGGYGTSLLFHKMNPKQRGFGGVTSLHTNQVIDFCIGLFKNSQPSKHSFSLLCFPYVGHLQSGKFSLN